MGAEQETIRVMLVDDHKTIHEDIGALLEIFEGIDLVAEAYNGEEAIEMCNRFQPDVVLMDVAMPVMNGILATRTILSLYPSIRIIAMTGIDDTQVVQSMIASGALGYVLKDGEPQHLESTIRSVYAGNAVFSSSVMQPLLRPDQPLPDYGLSARELQVLALLARGATNAQIAHELQISQPTVRFHFNNILDKLNVQTRSEALVLAARLKLI